MAQNEGYDTLKIYIGLMGGLALITTIWLIYNQRLSGEYEREIKYGITTFDKIKDLIPDLPPIQEEVEAKPIENVQTFFKRAIVENFPAPIVEPEEITPRESPDDVPYNEYKYEVNFKKQPLSRAQIVRYVLVIQKRAPHLKLKSMNIIKFPGAEKYQDRWEVESLVFAFNKEKEE